MSGKQFEEDAYNFATGCSDPRSGVDIFIEGAEWGYEYAIQEFNAKAQGGCYACEVVGEENRNNAAELGQLRAENRRLGEALVKHKQNTCGLCKEPCGNDWCPTKKEKK